MLKKSIFSILYLCQNLRFTEETSVYKLNVAAEGHELVGVVELGYQNRNAGIMPREHDLKNKLRNT